MTSVIAVPPAAASAPAGSRRGVKSWCQWLLLGAPVGALAVLGWGRRFITDDGFIYFRIVQQIRAGHGMVFNPGQRVEAFTSPVWVALLTLADMVTPVRLEWLAVLGGIAGSAGGLALAILGSVRLVRLTLLADVRGHDVGGHDGGVHEGDGSSWLVPVGAIVVVALLPMWYFATSGLETGLVFGWQGLSLWIMARWAGTDRRVAAWGAIVLGLGWLVRPDLVVLSAAFLVALLAAGWRTDRWRDRARLAGLMVALPLAYQLFRMGYYGSLVPNTAIAKEGSRARWGTGWNYFKDFVEPYELWIPLLLLALGAYFPLVRRLWRDGCARGLWLVGAFAVGGLLSAGYVVRVGGDYFHGRMLLPALFALCAPVAVVPLRRAYAVAFLVVPWAVVCATMLRAPGALQGGSTVLPITVEGRGWGPGGGARAWYRGAGLYYATKPLGARPAAGVTLPTDASYGIGIESYALGPQFRVLDLLGLADPFTARLRATGLGFPGHEKPLPAPWAAAFLTTPGSAITERDFPQSQLIPPLLPATSGARFTEQVAWARAALRCPPIRKLERSTRAPLSIGRFFSNVVDSFETTRMRIPPDPEAAYHELCGPGRPASIPVSSSGPSRLPSSPPRGG